MYKKKSVFFVFFTRLLGFVLFLIILHFANLYFDEVSNPIMFNITQFLLQSLALILTFSVFFGLGASFKEMSFPWPITFPLFDAIGALFFLTFVFQLFSFVDTLLGLTLFSVFSWIAVLIYPLVFIGVLVAGYFGLFTRYAGSFGESYYGEFYNEQKTEKKDDFIDLDENGKQKKLSWSDIGLEIKKTIFDFFHKIRQDLRKK